MNEGKTYFFAEGLSSLFAPLRRASQRRVVFLLLFSAFVGLVLLLLTKELIPRSPTGGTEKTAPPNPLPVTNGEDASLAEELAAILSQVAGAGRVEVRLTFEASTAREWEENRRRNRRTSEERTKEGNLQITSEETEETTLAVVRKADGSETLVEKAARMPVVAGAIVVAEGAADPEIRAELARATATFLHIGLHRVVVLPRKEEKGR